MEFNETYFAYLYPLTNPVHFLSLAGLRLLPTNQSQAIISEVLLKLQASPFLVTSPNSASVITGQDEGIYAWVSINFLLGRFQTKNNVNTIPIMEMGGASLQVWLKTDSISPKFSK